MEGESINSYSSLQTLLLVLLSFFLSADFSSVEYLARTEPLSKVLLLCILCGPSFESWIIDMLGSFGVFKSDVLLC